MTNPEKIVCDYETAGERVTRLRLRFGLAAGYTIEYISGRWFRIVGSRHGI